MQARFDARRAAVARWLRIEPAGPARIHLVRDLDGMRAHVKRAPEWAAALVTPDDRMVIRLDRVDKQPNNSLELVLAHEVVHHVLNGLRPHRLPRWFEEGLCEYYSGVPFIPTGHGIERMAAAGNLPTLAEAEEGFSGDAADAAMAYRVGRSAVTNFFKRFGERDLRQLLAEVRTGKPFARAFRDATGEDVGPFEERWRAEVTPGIPFLLYLMLENLELTLLCFGALVVAAGYLRWRLRRTKAMASLGE
ncbi:MAG: peptidase MA family metallohydrolase [Planctomycetota bacterium]